MKREGTSDSMRSEKSHLKKKVASLKKSPYLVPAVMKPTHTKKKTASSKLPPIRSTEAKTSKEDDRKLNWKQSITNQSDLKTASETDRFSPIYGYSRSSTPGTDNTLQSLSRPNSAFQLKNLGTGSRSPDSNDRTSFTAPEIREAGQLTPRSVSRLRKSGTLSPRQAIADKHSLSALDLLSDTHRDERRGLLMGEGESDTSLEHLYTAMQRDRTPSDVSLASDGLSSITSLDRVDLSEGQALSEEGLIKLDVVSERTGKVLVKALVQRDVPLYHVRLLLNRAFTKKLPKGYHFISPSGKGIVRSQEKSTKVTDAATSYFEGCSIVTVIVRIPPAKQKKLPFDGPVNVEEAIKKEKNEREVISRMTAAYQAGAFEVLTLIESKMQHFQLRIKDIFNQIDTNQNMEIDMHELRQAIKFLKLSLSDQQLFSLMAFLDQSGDGLIQVSELETSIKQYRRFCSLSSSSPQKYLQQVLASGSSTKPSAGRSQGNQSSHGLLREMMMMDTSMRRRQNLLRPLGYDAPSEQIEDISAVSEELNLMNAMHSSPPTKRLGFSTPQSGPPDPTWLKLTDEEIIDVLAFLGLLQEEASSTLKKIRIKLRERARFDSRDHFGRVAFRVTSMLDMMEQGWAWIKYQQKSKAKDLDLQTPESVISHEELDNIVEFLDQNKSGIHYEKLKKAFQVVCNTYSKEWAVWVLLCDRLDQQMSHPEEFLDVLFPTSPEGGRQKEISRKTLKAALNQVGMSSKETKKIVESLQRIKSKSTNLNESQVLGSEYHVTILTKAMKKAQEMWETDNSVDLRLCLDLDRTPDILGVKAVKANIRRLYGRLKEKGLRLSDMFFPGGAQMDAGGALFIPHQDLVFGLQDMNDPPERVTAKAQSRQEQNARTQQETLERRKNKMEQKEKMKLLKGLKLSQVVQKIGTQLRKMQKDLKHWFPEGLASTESLHEVCQQKLGIASLTRTQCDQLAIFLNKTWTGEESSSDEISDDDRIVNLPSLDDLIKQYRKYQWQLESSKGNGSSHRLSSAPWTTYKSFSEVFVRSRTPKRHALSGIDFAAGLGKLREENQEFTLSKQDLQQSPRKYELEDVAGLFFQRLYEYLDGDEMNLALSLGARSSSSEVTLDDIRVWLQNLSWSSQSGSNSPASASTGTEENQFMQSPDSSEASKELGKEKRGLLFAEREVFLLIDVFEEVIHFEKPGSITVGNLWKIINKSVSAMNVEECTEETNAFDSGERHHPPQFQQKNLESDLRSGQATPSENKQKLLFQSSASLTEDAEDELMSDHLEDEDVAKVNEAKRILQKGKRFGQYLLLVSIDYTDEEILIKGIDVSAGVNGEISLPVSGLEDVGLDVKNLEDKKLGRIILGSLKFTVGDIAGGQFAIDWNKLNS